MGNIVKVGTVELTFDEAFNIYQAGKYIVSYSGVYQLFYSVAQNQVSSRKVYNEKGIARRGRFYVMDGKEVNRIIGFDHLG